MISCRSYQTKKYENTDPSFSLHLAQPQNNLKKHFENIPVYMYCKVN